MGAVRVTGGLDGDGGEGGRMGVVRGQGSRTEGAVVGGGQ